MKIKLLIFAIVILKSIVIVNAQQTVLETNGPVGGTLTTDDYGIVSSLTVGSGMNEVDWVDYSTSFVVFNEEVPLEVSANNADIWDGIWPTEPCPNGFFIPNRFEDWTYDALSLNVWSNVLEYQSASMHIVGGVGHQLLDPSPKLGYPYVEWNPAYQFTNVGNDTVTITSPVDVDNDGAVEVIFAIGTGLENPNVEGSYNLDIKTTAEETFVTSDSYNISDATELSITSITTKPDTVNESGEFKFNFRVSSSGALTAYIDTIAVIFHQNT